MNLQASSYNFIITQALESLHNPERRWVSAKRGLWLLIGALAYAVNQTKVWAPKCNLFSNTHCMSLHYCWPTRALNSFCVTEFINLPSLHGWQMLLERRPCSQGKQLAGSCFQACPKLEQRAWGGGPAHSCEASEHAGLGRGWREPMGPAVYGAVTPRCGAKGAQAHGSQSVPARWNRPANRARLEASQGNWRELTLTTNLQHANLSTLLGGWLA